MPRLRSLDVALNRDASKEAKDALVEAVSKPALERRQHNSFCAAARLLLLAHTRDARGVDDDPLCRLPEGVLTLILDLARPEGFPPIAPVVVIE